MSFKQLLLDVFNFLSPVEAYPYDEPTEELARIDSEHEEKVSALNDEALTIEIQKALLIESVGCVKKLAVASAIANQVLLHPHDFRLAKENPTDKDYQKIIGDYLSKVDSSSLDALTISMLEQAGAKFPSLQQLFTKFKNINPDGVNRVATNPSPSGVLNGIEKSRLLDKQTVMNPRKAKKLQGINQ